MGDGEFTECRGGRQGLLPRRATGPQRSEVPPIVHEVLRSPGRPLDTETRAFMEPRFGHDFSRVRVHTDTQAAESAQAVNADAYTIGTHVVFGSGRFSPHTLVGRHLLAHELTHALQQSGQSIGSDRMAIERSPGAAEREAEAIASRVMRDNFPAKDTQSSSPHPSTLRTLERVPPGPKPMAVFHRSCPVLQRRVSYDVLDWDARKLGPPTPVNGTDPRYVTIPDTGPGTGQISVSALVEVNGDASDNCPGHELGTMQTAWMAWTVAHYRGQSPGDGQITVSHRPPMPMRDPAPAGSIWYDPANLRNPAACGDAVGVFHLDSPWHSVPKMRYNSAVSGNPLNYLRSYTRGLHLVTYLTAREPGGNFLRHPLRFLYWNSLQDFDFIPDFADPLLMWAYTGRVRVNIGAKGRGTVSDAPYFTTAGGTFNAHFNNPVNWTINERP